MRGTIKYIDRMESTDTSKYNNFLHCDRDAAFSVMYSSKITQTILISISRVKIISKSIKMFNTFLCIP